MNAMRVCARCLAFAGFLTLAAPTAFALTGHVKSVDTDARRLVVFESGTNQETEVTVNPQATIRTASGRPLDFRLLKAGDGISLAFSGNRASDVVVNQAPLRGQVKSSSPTERTLVVTQAGTDRNIGVAIAKTATISGSGRQPLAVADLKKGDAVAMILDGATAMSIVVNQAGLGGFIKSVDIDGNTLVVEETGTKRAVTVPVAKGVVVATTDGKAIGLKDLKQGDGVVVNYDGPRVSSIDVQFNRGMAGVVKTIGANLRTIVIAEVGTGKESTIGLNDETTIHTNDGKALTMSDLKEGDGVGIALGEGGVAKRILVNPKP